MPRRQAPEGFGSGPFGSCCPELKPRAEAHTARHEFSSRGCASGRCRRSAGPSRRKIGLGVQQAGERRAERIFAASVTVRLGASIISVRKERPGSTGFCMPMAFSSVTEPSSGFKAVNPTSVWYHPNSNQKYKGDREFAVSPTPLPSSYLYHGRDTVRGSAS